MKSNLMMIIFILILGSVCGTILITVDYFTSPKIKENVEVKKKTSLLKAFKIDFNRKNLKKVFETNIISPKLSDKSFYQSTGGNYAIIFSGKGLWGPISGILSIKKDRKTIKSLKILHQEETPGLGGRIAERKYLNSFSNKKFKPELYFSKKEKELSENEVHVISGATMSSKAFLGIINDSYKKLIEKIEDLK